MRSCSVSQEAIADVAAPWDTGKPSVHRLPAQINLLLHRLQPLPIVIDAKPRDIFQASTDADEVISEDEYELPSVEASQHLCHQS